MSQYSIPRKQPATKSPLKASNLFYVPYSIQNGANYEHTSKPSKLGMDTHSTSEGVQARWTSRACDFSGTARAETEIAGLESDAAACPD